MSDVDESTVAQDAPEVDDEAAEVAEDGDAPEGDDVSDDE